MTNHMDQTPLIVAAHHGQHSAMELLADRGADVHTIDSYGRNALAWAVSSGDLECVRLAMVWGVAPKLPDHDRDALDDAYELEADVEDRQAIIDLLEAHPAYVDRQ